MNQTKFEAFINKQVGTGHIHNIVAQVQSKDGWVDFAAAAGYASVADQTPMTTGTPYFIASVSKTYTAAMIMRLHEQGTLNLDTPISAYLPAALLEGLHVHNGHEYSQQIKVYQLVSQTSGLPDYFEGKPQGGRSLYDEVKHGMPDRAYSSEELMAIVRGLAPKFAPDAKDGKRAHYADTNYHLLGAIIEAVTGQSYAENLTRMICEPLALVHTYAFDAAQAASRQKPAMMYFKDRPLDLPLFISSHMAEGGIVSTTAESLTFLRAFFAGELFDKKHFERMMRQWNSIFFPIQYAYGMMRFKVPRLLSPFRPTPELIGHSGSTGSFAFYMPARELYFAGTINQAAAPGKPFRLMLQMANMAAQRAG